MSMQEWDDLIDRHLDGVADAAERERLFAALARDPDLAARLVQRVTFEDELHRAAGRDAPVAIPPARLERPPPGTAAPRRRVRARPPGRRRVSSVWIAGGMAALLLVGIGIGLWSPWRSAAPTPSGEEMVDREAETVDPAPRHAITILEADAATPYRAGQTLALPAEVRADGGSVTLALHEGDRIRLSAGARLAVTADHDELRVRHGGGQIEAALAARGYEEHWQGERLGFAVLGTRFTIGIESEATWLSLHEGRVRAWPSEHPSETVDVDPGQRVVVDAAHEIRRYEDLNDGRRGRIERYPARDQNPGMLVYLPPGYDDPPAHDWPLIIWLHGAERRGDGDADLDRVQNHGMPAVLASGVDVPAVVVAPQATQWFYPQLVDRVIALAESNFRVDPDRIILAGVDAGGAVVWRWANLHPDRIAALLPMLSVSDPIQEEGFARNLKDVPIWAWHAVDHPAYKTLSNWFTLMSDTEVAVHSHFTPPNATNLDDHRDLEGTRPHAGVIMRWDEHRALGEDLHRWTMWRSTPPGDPGRTALTDPRVWRWLHNHVWEPTETAVDGDGSF